MFRVAVELAAPIRSVGGPAPQTPRGIYDEKKQRGGGALDWVGPGYWPISKKTGTRFSDCLDLFARNASRKPASTFRIASVFLRAQFNLKTGIHFSDRAWSDQRPRLSLSALKSTIASAKAVRSQRNDCTTPWRSVKSKANACPARIASKRDAASSCS